MDEYYYILVGGLHQYPQQYTGTDQGVLSKPIYKEGLFLDFRGVNVGSTKSPQELGVTEPYPNEVRVPDVMQSSGVSVYRLKFGVRPRLSERNTNPPTSRIGLLSDSGSGNDPASNLGLFSKVGGAGLQPIDGIPAYLPQVNEKPEQAASHPGYNDIPAEYPSTLETQKKKGLIK